MEVRKDIFGDLAGLVAAQKQGGLRILNLHTHLHAQPPNHRLAACDAWTPRPKPRTSFGSRLASARCPRLVFGFRVCSSPPPRAAAMAAASPGLLRCCTSPGCAGPLWQASSQSARESARPPRVSGLFLGLNRSFNWNSVSMLFPLAGEPAATGPPVLGPLEGCY